MGSSFGLRSPGFRCFFEVDLVNAMALESPFWPETDLTNFAGSPISERKRVRDSGESCSRASPSIASENIFLTWETEGALFSICLGVRHGPPSLRALTRARTSQSFRTPTQPMLRP